MTVLPVPQTIRDALARRDSANRVVDPQEVASGQVRLTVTPQTDGPVQRLTLVCAVDHRDEFAEVMFVHPYTELATGADLVVPTKYSAVPYQIVVETDLRSVVWLTQLGSLIGVLDETALEAVGSVAVGEDPAVCGLTTGLALRGPADPRWDFKAVEGAAFRNLTDDCVTTQLGW